MDHAQILAAFREESEPGYILARRLRRPAHQVRRWLIKMEALSLVERDPRHSYVNSVSWRIKGGAGPCPAP
ncbi:hypothetical protein [Novosphingobium sp.]|uniref:hypothetical protein n=1 Tax=Novosphingobium sp. TaxID=1874826 RepID=UPI0038BD9C72